MVAALLPQLSPVGVWRSDTEKRQINDGKGEFEEQQDPDDF